MLDSDDIERQMMDIMLLRLGDERLQGEVEGLLSSLYERDRRVSEMLDDLLDEVDDLIMRFDLLDDCEDG
ncbi:MAG: hypothetical protein JW986_09955 [Methanotrichaceae archaeon]|nr:hypothetical protein [Methanotrichaceae archaeon]